MSLSKPMMNLGTLLLQILPWIAAQPNKLRKNSKIHDYSPYVAGTDYVFESSDNGMTGYMTAQGKGIKPGDYIILQKGSKFYKYQVEQIDYYSNPSDMWMASLKQVAVE
jgi:MioC protein